MANTEHQSDRLISPAMLASLVLGGIVLLAGLWLRYGLIGAGQWPISWLDVEGDLHRTSAGQIRAAAAGPAGRGFFAVDLARVRNEIEQLPWVASAEVSRHWPDALRLVIREHRPVARWNEHYLLSDRGEVFEVSGTDGMQGLAQLAGPETQRAEVLNRWLAMRNDLAAVGLDIQSLAVDERGAWRLGLDNGTELLLGREHTALRLRRYVAVHGDLIGADRRAIRVDMRYTNGLAVRWAGTETGESEHHG